VSPWLHPEPHDWWSVVEVALAEDIGSGDLSSASLPADLLADWYIEVQADGVLAGLGVAAQLMQPEDDDPAGCDLDVLARDGDAVRRGDVVIRGRLPVSALLSAERTALNFMMQLSGVATLTRKFVESVQGTQARIVDTRKTVPGLRALQKYAVRCGGGFNHRMGLYDGVMLKDNHIAAHGSVARAISAARHIASHLIRIEVECETPAQVQEAVAAGADVVMLDNMDPFMMREVVKQFGERVLLEASGGINLDTVRGVALTGVHLISVGVITHSAPALSMHLELKPR
jgi:nicotinate-nucleotide pyrophosphorylase (carboxylating)